jgi:PAS domain-containing protein
MSTCELTYGEDGKPRIRWSEAETGAERWIALKGYVFPDRRVLGVLQNVTDRYQARKQAARSDRGLRSLFESSHDGLVLWNDVMKIIDVNSAACEIYGVERDALIGTNLGAASAATRDDLWGQARDGKLGKARAIQARRGVRAAT